MRIYKREAFLNLPAGVIFTSGEPWELRGFSVKEDTIPGGNDFYYHDLLTIESENSGEHFDRLFQMLDKCYRFPLNRDGQRQGLFNDDEVFLVYERDDLAELIKMLAYAMTLEV